MMSESKFLISQDNYLRSGIHIGTKFKTKCMEPFVYKTRNDGLSVLNLQEIDKRITIAAAFLSRYNPEGVFLVSRRENGWKPVTTFGKATGCRYLAGRYEPGLLTNPNLKTYSEIKLLMVTDAWPDRNVVMDAVKSGVPVIALCDTNNHAHFVELVVPCNNKGKKSLGLCFYLLAKEYLKNIDSQKEFTYSIEDFTEE